MILKTAPELTTLETIARTFPTPFHLYSEARIRENARGLAKAFAWNPGFKEHYAVKACPTPGILSILKQEGCGVDCASLCELMLAEAMGFAGEDIMFSSNETQGAEFAYARKLGATINLDDYSLIDSLAANGGIPENVCLRFNPGGEFKLGNAVMGNPGDAKFGMTRAQLTLAIEKLRVLGAKQFALHAFLASNTTDDSYYPTMARLLFATAASLKRETGADIYMINLSGGVGIPYREEQNPVDIKKVGEGVRRAFEDILVPEGMTNVQIRTELGRYMTGPAGWLVARAVSEKRTHKHYIGLDACAADLMRPAMYGAYHYISVPGKDNATACEVYDVVGSLCENNDKFAVDRTLPEIHMGDLVVIHDTGAHGRSMGYNYNGKLRCAEVLLKEDGSFELIRRAETPADYFATLDFTGVLDSVLS